MQINRRVFIKQVGLGLGGVLLAPRIATALAPSDSLRLPRSTPESQGISSDHIIKFLEAIQQSGIEFHSLMIVRHGHVITEGWWNPYQASYPHLLYSVSKSFTSTAIGFAVQEGLLSVDDKVISFYNEELPAVISDNLAAMRIKDLLTMSTGHVVDTTSALRNGGAGKSWAKSFFEQPVEKLPGTFFLYNTGATYMAGEILQKKTGKSLVEYLTPRFFEPLGISDFHWEKNEFGYDVAGYGLSVTTETLAKLGLFYLQKGKWNGKQLLAENWCEEATKKQVESSVTDKVSDWGQGYGYQFWRNTVGGFRADGAFGQFSLVLPEQDMVVAITSESFDLGKSMNLVWTHLLPNVKSNALPINTKANTTLTRQLKQLSISVPVGESLSTPFDRMYTVKENDHGYKTIRIKATEELVTIWIMRTGGMDSVRASMNGWLENAKPFYWSRTADANSRSTKMAASARWKSKNELEVRQLYAETPHSDYITISFGGEISINLMNSISRNNPNNLETRKTLYATIRK
jgi:CubicO group peptidase (beta-lactamase class C family)